MSVLLVNEVIPQALRPNKNELLQISGNESVPYDPKLFGIEAMRKNYSMMYRFVVMRSSFSCIEVVLGIDCIH